MFGEKFVKREPYSELAEGYYAVDALLRLGKTVGADLPVAALFTTYCIKTDVKQGDQPPVYKEYKR